MFNQDFHWRRFSSNKNRLVGYHREYRAVYTVDMERNANEYSDLFYHCVQVLNEYKDHVSEQVFLEEYFQANKVPNPSFVSIVLIDCIRYSALLKIINEVFYKTDGIHIRRSEHNVYKVITYLIVFQIDSAGFKLLRGFINSFPSYQMHQFLEFLVNEDRLSTIKTECMKLYEEEYIDEKIIRVIQTYLPELRGILLDITDKIEGRTAGRQLPEPIKTKPFNLTVSKARIVPIPKTIPKMEKSRPPPKSTYEPPKEQIELEQIRDENHRQGLHKFHQTRSLTDHFISREKSTKTLNQQIKPLEENIQFRAHPPPSKTQTNKIPVKLNVATVLKESQLYRKQEEDVRRRLLDWESGGKDAQEFLQWQQTMQKQDDEQEINTIERKRLEGKISYEEAILARQRLVDENRQIADELRRQTREAIEKHVQEKLHEEQRMKQLVEEVVNGRDNAKLAQQKLQQYKIEFVKQYKEELKQSMKQALEKIELEMRQRAELIQQIRAFDLLPVDRHKPFDITSVAGHGLHEEMSIAEIRERLELLKLEREKERESRRDQIVKDKQIKEKLITSTVQNIAKYRNELTTQAVIKKQRNSSAPATVEKTNPELQQLKTYLDSKKAERLSKQQQRETLLLSDNQTTFRPTSDWNRFDQIDKSYDKTQKRLAPTLIS